MTRTNFLFILFFAVLLAGCSGGGIGPSPTKCGGVNQPLCAISQMAVDTADDSGFHQLTVINYRGNPETVRVRLNWVARKMGVGLICGGGCFEMNATVCIDSFPNPKADPRFASMMVRFFFSDDGTNSPGSHTGFGNVTNGSCLEINNDGSSGNLLFPGTRYLIAWVTPGPDVIDFGKRGPYGEQGASYVWDLHSQGF